MGESVKVKLLENFDSKLVLPSYESSGSAGADIRACLESDSMVIAPNERVLIPTGIAIQVPRGYEVQVRPRSGLSLKTGLMIVNAPGTIDSDYRGELKIIMGNLSTKEEIIKHGDRIAQLILAKVELAEFLVVKDLDSSDRGSGGFGSTGRS